jgi:hypothetical protein
LLLCPKLNITSISFFDYLSGLDLDKQVKITTVFLFYPMVKVVKNWKNHSGKKSRCNFTRKKLVDVVLAQENPKERRCLADVRQLWKALE